MMGWPAGGGWERDTCMTPTLPASVVWLVGCFSEVELCGSAKCETRKWASGSETLRDQALPKGAKTWSAKGLETFSTHQERLSWAFDMVNSCRKPCSSFHFRASVIVSSTCAALESVMG